MKTSPKGIAAIISYEGFKPRAYIPVPGDRLTIGYGFTDGVLAGDTITRAEADFRMIRELSKYEFTVVRCTGGKCNQNQFDALVSLAYNIGTNALAKSTVIRAHNRGDFAAAARAFGLWNKSSGKVYPGLVTRRAAEAAMYLTPIDAGAKDMPQTIDAEPSLMASKINKTGILAGGTTAVAAINEALNAVGSVKTSASGLGDWLVPALLVAVLCAIGYMIYERVQIREGGYK